MAKEKRNDYVRETGAAWQAAVDKVLGPVPAQSSTWKTLAEIQQVLSPFMGSNRNHAHYPTGGGMDFLEAEPSREEGCLEFKVSDKIAEVVKPSSLTLEYFPEAPEESFLFMELAPLAPLGINGGKHHEPEALVELRPGQFAARGVWDDGFHGHDAAGREIPLPPEARLVHRWAGSSIMLVCKGSIWNGSRGTYEGQHATMGREAVRHLIQRTLDQR